MMAAKAAAAKAAKLKAAVEREAEEVPAWLREEIQRQREEKEAILKLKIEERELLEAELAVLVTKFHPEHNEGKDHKAIQSQLMTRNMRNRSGSKHQAVQEEPIEPKKVCSRTLL